MGAPSAKTKAEIEALKAEAGYYRLKSRREQLIVDELELEAQMRDSSPYHNRIYTFDGVVNGNTVQHCIGKLGMWRRQDPSKPIQVVFNSPGGSVFDGLALYDYIVQSRQAGTRVDTVALGMVASMGGILLQAGESRTMSPHSYLMIHEVSSGAFGNTSEMEDEVKFMKRLQDRCLGILADRSTMSKSAISRKWKRTDWWLDADEARELGFCDEVK